MANPTTPLALHTVARLAARQAYGELPDRLLLDRFAADRDEAAFAALVERHGAVVLDAALAVLRHEQDAEDVFQATFLVLARKAGTVRKRDALGCWLYGVTRHIALRAVRARARRARHEAAPRPTSGDDLTWPDVRALVHDELARLPEALRAPVLLCHLQGLTLDEASARLEIPRGTLRGRLDRAREVLRRRLAGRGLALAALALPASVARAIAPRTVITTARAAARFAAGIGEPTTRAAVLANGAMSMTATYLKTCLLLAVTLGVVTLGVVGLGVAGTRTAQAPPAVAPAPRLVGQQPPAAENRNATQQPEFEEVTVVTRPSFVSNRTPETVRVSANGTCLYEVPERPARGEIPAWPPARIVHKLPPERLRELNVLLKGTEWLVQDAKEMLRLHHPESTITLKRDGKTIQLTLKGVSKPYEELLTFFRSVAEQEHIIYRLQWAPAAMIEGRRALDNLVAAELGEPFAKSPLAIDLKRYAPWATRLVRNPFGKSADDVRAAVRLVGLLRLESEREYLADLASDRDRDVRTAVAVAVGRLGGEKAVPVLRKLVRSTGTEAAWELIKLGEVAVPTIAKVIREGAGEEDMSYEWLIRAYIEHWKESPKPIDPRVLDAVRANMATPKVMAHRTVYHAELLKLAASAGRKE